MKIQLIKDDVNEITTVEERAHLDRYYQMLEATNFNVKIPLKDFFDLYFYNRLMEEKFKDKLFEIRLDIETAGKATIPLLNMHKNMYTRQMYLTRQLKDALQKRLNELNIEFNVEQKSKELIDALKKEKRYAGSRSKYLTEALNVKASILNQIEQIVGGSEPAC